MCGRYVIETDESVDMAELIQEINIEYPGIELKSGEIFPTDTVPLISGKEKKQMPATWGYPGFQGKGVIINARAETVTEKPMFRDGFINRRCIVPTNGYFEWSKSKDKYRFGLDGLSIIYLAGVYTNTPDIARFVILTTHANESVSDIHDRMPVILTGDMTDAWMHNPRDAFDCLHAPMPVVNSVLIK